RWRSLRNDLEGGEGGEGGEDGEGSHPERSEGAWFNSCPLRFAQGDSRPIPETQVCRGNVTVQVVSNPPRVLYTVVTVSRCGRKTPKRSSAILAVARSWKIPTL